jgi:hypothetical protein
MDPYVSGPHGSVSGSISTGKDPDTDPNPPMIKQI